MDLGQIRDGVLLDQNENGVPDDCEVCLGDLNHDKVVNAADIGLLLGMWGQPSDLPEADLNGDGVVDNGDFGLILANWGPCSG